MDIMMNKLLKLEPGSKVILEYDDGNFIVEGLIDTVYEEDMEDNEDVPVIYNCLVEITNFIQNVPNNSIEKYIEINMFNHPSKISDGTGEVIWSEMSKSK